ncbi:MAG: hypothetical protein BGN96_11410 [Bacteroidales bacterium 45-6]|nr:MAG: hypothetical protein BGN96_11410 [Bacteroidales bacterium 45-6]
MSIRARIMRISPLIVMLVVSDTAYSQMVQSELKKDLWKTIKPYGEKKDMPMSFSSPLLNPVPALSTPTAHDVMYYYNKMKTNVVLEDFYEQYRITHVVDPHLYTYSGDEPLTKIKAGYLETVFMGGHFQQVSPPGNTVGSGSGFTIDISGGGRKHVSEKTKKILKEVYDREVEE